MKKKEWYFGEYKFFRWIIEKVLRKKWLRNPTYAMRYLDTLSEEERKNLREQWLKEVKEYIEEQKRKGVIY